MSAPTRKDLARAVVSLSEKHSGKRLSEMLAAYLVQNRRSGELDSIMREVMRQRETNNGTVEITATSAFKLNDATKKAISTLLGAENTIINEVINPEMLGGVRLETSEKQLDLTVRNRLDMLRQGARD
jgi:F0F1-type ATP synthase delta subunit